MWMFPVKSPTTEIMIRTLQHWSTQYLDGRKPKIVLDNQSCFASHKFKEWAAANGWRVQFVAANQHHQNGPIENAWSKLIPKAISSLAGAPHLGDDFADECFRAQVDARNRWPCTSNEGFMSPHEAYLGTKPRTAHLRQFGCPTYVHDHTHNGIKVRATKGYMLGPSAQHADGVYGVWIPANKTVRQSMDVTFQYPDMPTDATLAAENITLELQTLPTIEPSNVSKAVKNPVAARNLFATAPPVVRGSKRANKPTVKSGSPASAEQSHPQPAYFDDNHVLIP